MNLSGIASAALSLFGGGNKAGSTFSKISASIPGGYLQFPANITTRPDISQYTYLGAHSNISEYNEVVDRIHPLGSLYLPLPKDLSVGYKSNWSTTDMGASASPDAKALFTNIGTNIMTGGDSFVQNYAKMKLKAISNPFKYTEYKGPELRSFTFSWDLVPTTGAEADALNKIIWTLKKYIHTPSSAFDGMLAQPPIWDIGFIDRINSDRSANKYLFQLKDCAISSLDINYFANGRAFHGEGSDKTGFHAPNGVNITIQFTETTILTQNDFGQNYTDKATK